MFKLVYYKYEVDAFDNFYSIDKIVIQYNFVYVERMNTFIDSLQKFYVNFPDVELLHYSSAKIGNFREQFSFKLGSKSFWVGVGLNAQNGVDCKGRCEFNPNNVEGPLLRFILNLFMFNSSSWRVVHYDLAVDMGVSRQFVYLHKDRRKYEEIRYSETDRTQYLGQRNSSGRVKLYNKALEQSISDPLTRFEITLDGDLDPESILVLCPKITVLDDVQLSLDCVDMCQTDLFIFRTLLESPERMCELSYHKRKKFLHLFEQYTRTFSLDLNCVSNILSVLDDFVNPFDMHDYQFNPFSGFLDKCVPLESI